MIDHSIRLHEAIAAVCPIDGVSIGIPGNSATVAVFPADQQAAAQATIDAFDWSEGAHNAWLAIVNKVAAKDSIDADVPDGKVRRAIADVLIDEMNLVRSWLASFKNEVAAATTLADLKTRVAGLPAMPNRTKVQAIAAIKAAIDADA